jgi:hypothetical protein
MVVFIEYECVEKLYSLSPNYEKIARIIYEDSLIDEISWNKHLLLSNAVEKYKLFLIENKKIVQELTQNKIASCLNISPETISRLRRDLTYVK